MRKDCSERSIFVVDDEPKVCEAICQTLEGVGAKVTCFGSAAECLERLRRQKCDLLITDLKMPQMDGVELLTNARVLAPWLPVLIITGYGDIPTAIKAVKAGAVNFIEKPLSKDDFMRQVESLLKESERRDPHVGASLTKSESRVLQWILSGKSNRQIADLLHRSVRTVEVHRSSIMRKLGAESLIDLLKAAAKMGLLDMSAEHEPLEAGQDPEDGL